MCIYIYIEREREHTPCLRSLNNYSMKRCRHSAPLRARPCGALRPAFKTRFEQIGQTPESFEYLEGMFKSMTNEIGTPDPN